MIPKEQKRRNRQPFFFDMKTLLTPLIPLILAGVGYLLEIPISYFGSKNVILGDLGDISQKENSTIAMIALLLQQLRMLSTEIYNGYFVFLAVMMILHLLINHSRPLFKQVIKMNSPSSEKVVTPLKDQQPIKKIMLNLLALILYYTICFSFIKLMGSLLGTYYLLPTLENQSQVETRMPLPGLRHLKEERMLAAQKPMYFKEISVKYFDDLIPFYILPTQDLQTVFVIQVSGFVAYNVSDPTFPKKLGSYWKTTSRFPSAVVSPSKKIVVLDTGVVNIVNVTDHSNPSHLSRIETRTAEEKKDSVNLSNPTVAISPDDQFIISCDPKVRIYDISDIRVPKLVFEDLAMTTSILLSADGRTAFVGGSSLRIFDVSDFTAPKLLSDFPISSHIFTMTLSKDQKTIYVLSGPWIPEKKSIDLVLEIVDITDPAVPFDKQGQIALGLTRDVVLSSLTVSPDGIFITLKNSFNVRLINLRTSEVADFMSDFKYPNLAFLPNGKNALIFSMGMIRFVEVYLNVPEDQSSSLQPNYLAQIAFEGLPKQIAVANRRGFILSSTDSGSLLVSVDLRDYLFPRIVQTFQTLTNLSLFTLSLDGKNMYYKSDNKTLQIVNIQQERGELSAGAVLKFDEDIEQMFLVSSDQKTLFTFSRNMTNSLDKISIYDISAGPKLMSSLFFVIAVPDYFFEFGSVYMALSPDEKTLFYLDQRLNIIDISNKANPILTNSFNYGQYLTKTFAFSSDYKTCYILATPFLDRKLLIIIDITDFEKPAVLSMTDLPMDLNFQLSVSRDDKLLFVSSSKALITLDVANKTEIKIVETQLLRVSAFLPVNENILVGNENGLQIMNRKPKYALEMSNHKFSLGKIYSSPVRVLEFKIGSNYSTIGQNYKFLYASLFQGEIKPLKEFLVSYPVLPSWIYFDRENALLKLDLTQQTNVTSYKICFSISTEVAADDFLKIKNANYTQDDVQNLQAYLFGQGYLDSDRYLTANFDEGTPLMLKTEYSKFELEIRKILKSHRIEIITPISLESSLKLIQDKPFQIVTPSLNFVHVEIKLGSVTKKSKFVSQAFSAVKTNLDDDKTVLTLEGASLYINEALKKLLVNLEDENEPCNGSIRISDGLNPPIAENFEDISRFIKTNKKPQMLDKNSVQGQVDNVAIIAGEHFNIEFDEMTFYDLNNRSLVYSLEMPDRNMEVPAWITLRGRTLMGTPPEQFWKYEKEFCIKASNEYKSEAIVFTLRIGLSYMIILKRVLFLMGYLFTAYKSWQHSDKFYNILCKKRYRYSKVIHVDGSEVTKKAIFPILMISKRVQKLSKSVLGEVKLLIGEGRVASDEKTMEYLVDSDGLNRQKLAEVIESLALKKQIGKNKAVILQLIANELTMKRIKSEKATLDIFEKIKSKWIDLVDIDDQGQFVIKKIRLSEELRTHGVNIDNDESGDTNEYSFDSEVLTSSTKLIISPRVNMGLLRDAILAYAFDQQNIWRSRYRIRIQSKELMEHARSKFWRRFLKFDTIDLVQNSAKQLGHGLKFEFIADQMIFYGKPKEEMKNKTLVIQITTMRGWILREMEIQGVMVRDLNDQRAIELIQEEL